MKDYSNYPEHLREEVARLDQNYEIVQCFQKSGFLPPFNIPDFSLSEFLYEDLKKEKKKRT
jgi:hypothetical protein